MIWKWLKLIELTGLTSHVSEDQYDLADKLMPLNIQARYPAYKEAIYNLTNNKRAKKILSRIKELILWLKSRIS